MAIQIPNDLQAYQVTEEAKKFLRLVAEGNPLATAENAKTPFEVAVAELDPAAEDADTRAQFLRELPARLIDINEQTLLRRVMDLTLPEFNFGAVIVSPLDFSVFGAFSSYSFATESNVIDTAPVNGTGPFVYEISFANRGGSQHGPWEADPVTGWSLGEEGSGNAWLRITDALNQQQVIALGATLIQDASSPSPVANSVVPHAYRNGETYPYVLDTLSTATDSFPGYPLEWKIGLDNTPVSWAAISEISYLGVVPDTNGTGAVVSVTAQPDVGDVGANVWAVYVRDAAGNFDFANYTVTVTEASDAVGPVATGGPDADYTTTGAGGSGVPADVANVVTDPAGGMQFRVRNAGNNGPSLVLKVQGATDNDTWYPATGTTQSQVSFTYESIAAYTGGETFTLEMRDRKGTVSTEAGTLNVV
jgi:hypothetical protein